ncbi:hypothetical protein GYMLUDRAFT_980257, partial [Collybiopsis luxurians FD-317 M1]
EIAATHDKRAINNLASACAFKSANAAHNSGSSPGPTRSSSSLSSTLSLFPGSSAPSSRASTYNDQSLPAVSAPMEEEH